MDVTLPTIPAGALVLLGLFAPYAIGALNGAFSFIRQPWQKKALAIVVAVALALLVLWFYYAFTGDTVPDWPVLVLLGVLIVQASYALITKPTASAIEQRVTNGVTLRRDLH